MALVTGDKRGGRQHHRWSALELVAPPSLLLVPLHAAAKCICAGVFVTVAMCVPGTGVQRDGCHEWLIIARRPQTSGWERVDDGARPGQLSVPWVMGQILVRETGSPRASSSNIRGLAGFTDSSDNTIDPRKGEQRKREEKTTRVMMDFAGLKLRGSVAAKAASTAPIKKARGLEVRIFDDGSSSSPHLLHTQAPTAHGSPVRDICTHHCLRLFSRGHKAT